MTGFLNNIYVPQIASYGTRRPAPYLSNLPGDFTTESSTGTVTEISGSLDWEMASEPARAGREIPRDQVKQAIIALFQESEILYPSDIVFSLDADYDQVMDILRELQEKGAIRPEL